MIGRTLTRASMVALVATGAEFAALPVLVRVLHLPRPLSFAAVQLLGNLLTFLLNKYWAFESRHLGSFSGQYLRQLIVFGGSWVLNTVIPTLLSERLRLPPELAFAVSNIVVYFAWNYPGNRFWVFRASRAP